MSNLFEDLQNNRFLLVEWVSLTATTQATTQATTPTTALTTTSASLADTFLANGVTGHVGNDVGGFTSLLGQYALNELQNLVGKCGCKGKRLVS